MSGRTIEIAEHLWTVLETMARDMATEPRALVNQAVFNWARRNGYAVSAGAVGAVPAAAPELAAVPVVEAKPAPVSVAKTAHVEKAKVAEVEAVEAKAKLEARADAKPELKTDASSEPKLEAKADATSEPKLEAKADATSEPKLEAKPEAPLAVPAPSLSQAVRVAAIDADVDRYCVVPVVVEGVFGEDDSDEEAAPPAPAPVAPAVDLAALRAAAAERVAVIERAVADVLPRPRAAVAATAAANVAAPARPTVTSAPASLAVTPPPASAPAAAPASKPAAVSAPAAKAESAPAGSAKPAPAATAGVNGKPRQRMDTRELDNLFGEVDDLLGQSGVRDTALSPAMSFVLELRVSGTDQVCIVAAEPVVIGRGSHCDLVLQSAEASREHAVVSRNGATYVIEDRGSSNGTWVNNEQVRSHEIHSGDVFRIGSVELVASLKVTEPQAKAG